MKRDVPYQGGQRRPPRGDVWSDWDPEKQEAMWRRCRERGLQRQGGASPRPWEGKELGISQEPDRPVRPEWTDRARGEGVGDVNSHRTLQAKVGSWDFVMVSNGRHLNILSRAVTWSDVGFRKFICRVVCSHWQEAQGGLVQESGTKHRKDVMAARAKW